MMDAIRKLWAHEAGQVTGVRQDAWASAHRVPTEKDRPSEKRGTYPHPELYRASADKNTDATSQE